MKPELWPEFAFHISIARPQTEYSLWVRTISIFTFMSTPSEATECRAPSHTQHHRTWEVAAVPVFPTWRHQLLSPLSTSLPLIASLSSTHTSLCPSLPPSCSPVPLQLFPELTFWSISWHLSVWKFTHFQRQPCQGPKLVCVSWFLPSFQYFLEDTVLHRITY